MQVIRPITVTPGMVTVNNAVDQPAYNPLTPYALDALVTYNYRTWKSAQAANTGHTPGDTASAEWWSDQGPSNRTAMFDTKASTLTVAPGEQLTFKVSGARMSALALFGMRGTALSVRQIFEGNVLHTREVDLWNSKLVRGFDDLFFDLPEFRRNIAITGLARVPEVDIEVTITQQGGTAALGIFTAGREFDVGREIYGLTLGRQRLVDPGFDTFGNLKISPNDLLIKEFSTEAVIENGYFDTVIQRLDELSTQQMAIIGANGLYDAGLVFGQLTWRGAMKSHGRTYFSLDARGLS